MAKLGRNPVKLVVGKQQNRMLNSLDASFAASVQAAMTELQGNLEYILDQFEGATPEIMYDALEPTFEKSQEYCPVDTGDMKASGYLDIVEFRGNPKVEMGYGKGGVPFYTAYVHEMVEMPHKAPTRAKWVEVAINEDTFDIIDRVSDGYKQFMGL